MALSERSPSTTDPAALANFRQLLFADQGLSFSASRAMGPEQTQEPWASFQRAAEHLRARDIPLAVQELKHLADDSSQESRVRLWAWKALRDLGQAPDASIGTQVLGVVIEVPLDRGNDVLASYADGSVRYLNQSGKIGILEPGVPDVEPLVKAEIVEAQHVAAQLPLIPSEPAPAQGAIRVTLLTIGGLRSIEAPMNAMGNPKHPGFPLFQAATKVLRAVTSKT